MKLVIQRVDKAKVEIVEGRKKTGEINSGLFVLVGVSKKDELKNAEELANKIAKLRVMKDENDKMNLTVKQVDGSFLVVSQFTLYADTSGGNRPSFINAAEPKKAEEIYEHFIKCLKDKGENVETGSFGDYMDITASLDGPVTIILEN